MFKSWEPALESTLSGCEGPGFVSGHHGFDVHGCGKQHHIKQLHTVISWCPPALGHFGSEVQGI